MGHTELFTFYCCIDRKQGETITGYRIIETQFESSFERRRPKYENRHEKPKNSRKNPSFVTKIVGTN